MRPFDRVQGFGICLVNPTFPRLSNPLGCTWRTLKIETNNNQIEAQVEIRRI